jgi:hypothetical protein
VLRDEIVKVKGRVKVITVKKEEFEKVLKSIKLRVLDKEYEALMPPLDGMQKNTIDVNGLASLVQQYLMMVNFYSGNTQQTLPAQMVLTTSGGTVVFSYTGSISSNSQGVTVYLQVLQESGNYTFQYFYVGFDTTNSSYTTSNLELYASAELSCSTGNLYTGLIRIAYTTASFTKTSDSYLFIVWLIEFQNIPSYLVYFTPILQNIAGVAPNCLGISYVIYFNNGSCSFTCGGNCPSAGCNIPELTSACGFIVYVQNNNVILEIPATASIGTGVSSTEMLLCTTTFFNNAPIISGSVSATLTPPVSGATFYIAIVTITITYVGS